MAKKVGKLASRYARALLSAVGKESAAEQPSGQGASSLTAAPLTTAQKLAAELEQFAGIYHRDERLASALLNPMFEKGERKNALVAIARTSGLSDVLVRFLDVCFERDRIAHLPEIAAAFREAADRAAGVLQVEVTTAREVGADERRAIEQGLVTQLKGSPRFTWKVDAAILGGMVVRYAGKVLDGSLGGRLARIETRLQSVI